MIRLRSVVAVAFVLALLGTGLLPTAAAGAAGTSTISGTVRTHDGSIITASGTNYFRLSVYDINGNLLEWNTTISTTTGQFTTPAFPTQPVRIRLHYGGQRLDIFSDAWVGSGVTYAESSTFTMAEGPNTLDITLPQAPYVTGTAAVADDSAPLGWLSLGLSGGGSTRSGAIHDDGSFSFGGLPPGSYTLTVDAHSVDVYEPVRWRGETREFVIEEMGETFHFDIVLQRVTGIDGTVTVSGKEPSGDGYGPLRLYAAGSDPATDGSVGTGVVRPDGSFQVPVYEPGDYYLCVPASIVQNWKPACAMQGDSIRTFSLGTGDVVTGVEIFTTQWGGITGGLRHGTHGGSMEANLTAHLYRQTPDGYVYAGSSDSRFEGNYRFGGIEPGVYALEFVDPDGLHAREYWEDQRYWANHDTVTVEAGATEQLDVTVLEPRDYEVTRLQGPDRFATSVAISKARYADGEDVPVVYIASGVNYPDALAAGPAAAHLGGTLMIVQPYGIPPVVAAELARIDPQRIVVVGSAAAVGDNVIDQLEAYVDDPSDIERIGGANRFETSRMIVDDAWGPGGADVAFFATGYNFPDALAAVPAAAMWDAPIILVPGTAGSLDSATRSLMNRLGIQAAHIVGSEAAVTAGIQSGIESIVGDLWIRYAGVNRFATAVLISIVNFEVADRAYLATGYNFADALAAGPSAAAEGAPIYLTNGTCVFDIVMSDIEGVGANGVVVLGSTAAQTSGVSNLTVCASGLASGEIATGEISGPGFAEGELRLPEGVMDPRE